MRPARPHRSNTDERGVVLIFVALTMVAILVIASIVIDLGQLRNTRRQSQSATDLASLAAGYYLSGHGNAAATSDPRGACNAALNSLRSNLSDLPAATALDCDSLPLTGSAPYCTSITSIPPLTATGASPYEVTIQYPVPASEIRDSRFAGGTGVNDGTAATSQCERMKVTVRRTNGAIFSGIMGIASSSTGASSVVRSTTGPNPDRVAALLLLERVGCSVLSQGGGGSQGGGVLVESSGASKPGVIQADSAGVVGATVGGFGSYQPCTTNENATGYVVYGTALPVAGGGGTSITAKASSDGSPGIIGIYGLAIGGRGGAVSNTGISPAATAALPMSRVGADNKYNGDPLNGGSEQITTFHASAYALTTGAAPSGYRVLSGSACNGLNTSSTPVTEQYVYVNCADFSPDTAVFPNATHVIFTGKISVANNKLLSLPAAREIDVRGCTSGCSGGGNYAISVAGDFWVNTGSAATTNPPACSTRSGPGAGGTNTNWTKLATFNGPFNISGTARLCQTFVYLGENQATYTKRVVTSTGSGTENYPPIADCQPTLPCPSSNGGPATIVMSGGSAAADWTAPNQLATSPTKSDFATYPFEDIALWTESSVNAFVKGQGSNRTEGVFFTPNSAVTFNGQGTQSVPLNAQFICRTLTISGQGTLSLKPNPADSITSSIAGPTALIR